MRGSIRLHLSKSLKTIQMYDGEGAGSRAQRTTAKYRMRICAFVDAQRTCLRAFLLRGMASLE
jgi:hypothetical protein